MLPLLGTVALSAACTTGEEPAAPAPPATTAPATASATADPTGTPSASAPTTVTIPTSAFVELPEELLRMPRRATPVEQALPTLCAEEFGTGGRQVTAAAAMTVTYKKPGEPDSNVPQGIIHQTLFTFSADGAPAYLRRLDAAVKACPSYTRGDSTIKVKVEALPGIGDEAVLVTRTWPQTSLNGEPTGGTATSQIAVVRSDEVVTVLGDQGWEGTSGDPAVLDRVTRDAVRAIDAWQR
ncbi:hypothetical protein D7223_13425 [Micromonospora endolithica]|uniref:Sensor domain-containing protein n=1 Tax=Micromonospora endolithica TaxID=230091 RepID=A0A3A9ZIY7_9ACTN|nr:hypothetical protein D7223_13425 [Micromonospora endolithica]